MPTCSEKLVETQSVLMVGLSDTEFHREMSRRGFKTVITYLDDFLIISKTKEKCQMTLRVELRTWLNI